MLSTGWMQLVLWLCLLDRYLINNFNLRIKTTVYKQCWPCIVSFRKYCNFVPFCFLVKSVLLSRELKETIWNFLFSNSILANTPQKLPCFLTFHESKYLRQKMYQLPHQSENNLIKTNFVIKFFVDNLIFKFYLCRECSASLEQHT